MATDATQKLRNMSDRRLRRSRILPRPNNQSRSQNHRLLEVQRLDSVLELPLHLGIPEARVRIGPAAADEHVDLDAGLLGRLRKLEVQVIVDLALVVEAACCGAGRAQGGEEEIGSRLEGRDGAGPFGGVFDDGIQLGVGGLGCAARERGDGADDWELDKR